MRILVLGAAGFIGSRLAAALRARGGFTALVLADSRPPGASASAPHAAVADGAVRSLQGDICSEDFLDRVFDQPFDVVYHLAASLTLDAETDFARGMAVNVHALMRLLERCRAQPAPPRLLFASSISTFGGPLPEVVGDRVAQTPQTSYGTHKAIAELLISDYARRGYLDGRALRLPVVLTHPGPPGTSVSDRIASLIREPLAGKDTTCPLAPDTRIPVASVQAVVTALLRLQDVPAAAFGAGRALNLPSLTLTPADIAAAVARAPVTHPRGSIRWEPDPQLQAIVDSWPRGFDSALARSLGIVADASADAIVARHLEATHVPT
ncbi:MAG TPA: NAD-dependent epimerase/dehydratase family protein [Noviherbaspirillum sp.]|jgi:nucleoside-diphosphate-sugar epimerase|uniref:NAD-dependent epimerase/dehydratase family protein n=1 Tax=Noviherbaspirillum sp. TaxID=1926288 RepID=UPI002F923DF9